MPIVLFTLFLKRLFSEKEQNAAEDKKKRSEKQKRGSDSPGFPQKAERGRGGDHGVFPAEQIGNGPGRDRKEKAGNMEYRFGQPDLDQRKSPLN